MAANVYRLVPKRPIKTRVVISVRFIGVEKTCSSQNWGLTQSKKSMMAPRIVPLREPGLTHNQCVVTDGVTSGKVLMRLRLVGQSASTMKEYHHAESLPA